MTVKFINLTPHTLNIITPSGVVDIPTSGDVARVDTKKSVVATVGGIPILDTVFGGVTGLPPVTDGKFFIVSRIVKNAVSDRKDVLVPGAPVRDDDGVIIGADGLTL